jgi:hypothetical protein
VARGAAWSYQLREPEALGTRGQVSKRSGICNNDPANIHLPIYPLAIAMSNIDQMCEPY